MIISGLLLVMAPIALILGLVVQADTTFEDMTSDQDPEGRVDAGFGVITAIITAVIAFAAVCGGCTGHLKNKYYTCAFQVLALGMTGFLFFMGGGFFAIRKMGDELCEVVNDPEKRAEVPELQVELYDQLDVTIKEVDEDIAGFIGEHMCTEVCPCYRGENDSNYNLYQEIGEDKVNEFGRTLVDPSDPAADVNPTYLPFVWRESRFSSADDPLDADEGGYESLLECSEDLAAKGEAV